MTKKKVNTPGLDWKAIAEETIIRLEDEKSEMVDKAERIDSVTSDIEMAVEDLENALEQAKGLLP